MEARVCRTIRSRVPCSRSSLEWPTRTPVLLPRENSNILCGNATGKMKSLNSCELVAGCKRGRMMLPCADSTLNRTRVRSREAGMSIRPVKRLIKAKPTMEGAGVHLRRAFGFGNTTEFDPVFVLDGFRNDGPGGYFAGFPWDPHPGSRKITDWLAR